MGDKPSFAAKYPAGGGNYSVPLQWMLGLRRLGLDAIWLELLPATENPREDESRIRIFQRRLHEDGLKDAYCLLYQTPASDAHDVGQMRCIGISRQELRARLAGPNTLLNPAIRSIRRSCCNSSEKYSATWTRARFFIG